MCHSIFKNILLIIISIISISLNFRLSAQDFFLNDKETERNHNLKRENQEIIKIYEKKLKKHIKKYKLIIKKQQVLIKKIPNIQSVQNIFEPKYLDLVHRNISKNLDTKLQNNFSKYKSIVEKNDSFIIANSKYLYEKQLSKLVEKYKMQKSTISDIFNSKTKIDPYLKNKYGKNINLNLADSNLNQFSMPINISGLQQKFDIDSNIRNKINNNLKPFDTISNGTNIKFDTNNLSTIREYLKNEWYFYKGLFKKNSFRYTPISYRIKPIYTLSNSTNANSYHISIGLGCEINLNNFFSLGLIFNSQVKVPKQSNQNYSFENLYSKGYLNFSLPFNMIVQNGFNYYLKENTDYTKLYNHFSLYSSIGKEFNISKKRKMRFLFSYNYMSKRWESIINLK